MKKIATLAAIILLHQSIYAQLTTVPSGGNKKASIGERVGLTDITIHYDRSGVKGREGKIWGMLVAPGYNDLGFGNTKQAPWRAGANENTTMEFSTDVKIEGQSLPAGKYAFFIAYDSLQCTLIFSKNNSSWGSFYYKPSEDALRVKVKPVKLDKSVEWLKYEFIQEGDSTATIALEWEKLMIQFKVETDLVATQIASFRRELQSDKGFFFEAWAQAAQWCATNNTNLEEALLWADTATSANFAGDKSFSAWNTKSTVLKKLNRTKEANDIMKKILPYGSMIELHVYARQLLKDKSYDEAFEVFKTNYDKHPNEFTTNMGMARGYSGKGNYKEALKYAEAALPQVPDPVNKASVTSAIEKLKAGKDIN